jgi:hypothetical protein
MTNDAAPLGARDERRAKTAFVLKATFEVLAWLAALALFAYAGRAVLAA